MTHGMFLRDLDFLSPEQASRLDHVAPPVDVRGRNVNRALRWYARARCDFMPWTWFTTDPNELAEAIAFAHEIGARAFVLNGEKELRGKPATARLIARTARAACDRHGLQLGLVSYSVPSTVRDFPWRVFAEVCDFGMGEVYDREGAFDPRYPARSRDSYLAAGFRSFRFASGAYQRQDDGTGFRWRRTDELERHLGLFPCGAVTTAWPIGGQVPDHVVAALAGE